MKRDRQFLLNNGSAMDGMGMYETNFGFHRQPFQCADLARAFFVSESIRRILPNLMHALRSDLGIAVLTGPAGVGRTSLLKHLQTLLSRESRVIMCSGASLETPADMLQVLQTACLLRQGDSTPEVPATAVAASRWAVAEHLRKTTEFWGPVLLLIDDAQLLSVAVLNELRALTEEEWNGRALVRCLVSGPLNFEEELTRPAHADFSRRVRCHAFLQPMNSHEIIQCLKGHIEAAGGQLREAFTRQALELIASASDGIPRCLSLLADESLVVAAEQSKKLSDEDCVRKALTRLQHLAYAWNASPLMPETADDDYESDEPEASSSYEPATKPPVGTRSAGVVEFGSPGVIEVGSPPSGSVESTAIAEITPEEVHPAEEIAAEVEFTAEVKTASAEPRVVGTLITESSATELFEFSSTEDGTFEVGHRYQPDDLESAEAVEMDAFEAGAFESNAADTRTHQAEDDKDEDTHLEMNDYDTVPSEFSVIDSSLATCSVAESEEVSVSAELVTAHPESPSASAYKPVAIPKHEVQFFGGIESVREPVESAGDSFERSLERLVGAGLSSRLPVFDRYTWLALGREVPTGNYSISTASQMHRVTLSLSGGDQDYSETTKASLSFVTFDSIPVCQISDTEITASLSEHAVHDEHGGFLVRTQPTRSPQVQAPLPEVHEESDLVQEEATLSKTSQEWRDGQLLFDELSEDMDSENTEEEIVAADLERISLSFEAARVARDGHLSKNPETASPESPAEKFFTLAHDLQTTGWDFRGSAISPEDIAPLADSLASLQEEVTAFRENGRMTDPEDAAPKSDAQTENSSAIAAQQETLIVLARKRLENAEFSDSDMMPDEEAVTVGLPLAPPPQPKDAGADHIGESDPGFARLFTRLREIRAKADENQ